MSRRYSIPTIYEKPDDNPGTVLGFPDQTYSDNKKELKSIINRYGLSWDGQLKKIEDGRSEGSWSTNDGSSKVEAIFQKDPMGKTIWVNLRLTTDDSELEKSLIELTERAGGHAERILVDLEVNKRFKVEQLALFDKAIKDKLEAESLRGCPAAWLEDMRRDFAVQRKEVFE